MSLSNPKLPPKKIGNYQLGELIGKGAIGWVYKGMNTENGSMVAIKQISLQNVKADQRSSIQSEINLLKRLKHENIVKYVDSFQTETHLNIVLEYIESGSLALLNKKFGPFQESLVAVYIKQVLQGLDYLHKQGVVHRDIKGGNILTTKNGTVKLADFGVALSLTEETKSPTFVGTPYWMAPEVIEMRSHISTACDIWSLACTVIELLTGNPPYYDLNQYSALCRIVEDERPSFPENISENCKDFLSKCFQKEPSLRLEARELLRHPWIGNQNQIECYEMINSPDNELPEEVTNTIRNHMNKGKNIEKGNVISSLTSSAKLNVKESANMQIVHSNKFISDGEIYTKTKEKESSLPQPLDNLLIFSDSPGKQKPNNSTIYEEGSFISVIDNNENNFTSNLATIQNFRVKKNENQRNSTNRNSKKEHKIRKEISEIMINITNWTLLNSNYEDLVMLLTTLTALLRENPKSRYFLMKQYGLSIFIELIDLYLEHLNTIVLHAILQVINQIIESDTKLLETSYLFGILPYMLKFSHSEFPKEIRMESAYFVGQMFYSSENSHKILVACGGLAALNEFLDINYSENKELISLSIDCLYILFEIKTLGILNLCKILSKYHIIQRLLLIIDQISLDKEEEMIKYLVKALVIITHFAKCEDKKLKTLFCDDNIIQLLRIFLINFQNKPVIQAMIIKIFKILAFEPMMLSILENNSILQTVLNLIPVYNNNSLDRENFLKESIQFSNEKNQNTIRNSFIIKESGEPKSPTQSIKISPREEVLQDLLKILFYLTKLSLPRQEQLALHSGIPLLLNLTLTSYPAKKLSLQILCFLVQTSYLSRGKLWEAGGVQIFTENLSEKENLPKILETLCVWLSIDKEKVEDALVEGGTMKKLVEVFCGREKESFQQIVPGYLKLIQSSDKIAERFGKEEIFLCELLERLGVEGEEKEGYGGFIRGIRRECQNPSALIRKEILDILVNLCARHGNPRLVLERFYGSIVQILHIAQNDNMVILEEIATQLLQVYSESNVKY